MTIAGAIRGQNFFEIDANMQATLGRLAPEALKRWRDDLSSFGQWVGTSVDEQAEFTDRFAPPALETYDSAGETVNHIALNPLWDACSREAYERGMVGLNYGSDPAPYIVTFAMGYLMSQADISLHCPITMTGAVAHVIAQFAPEPVRERFLNAVIRRDGKALSGGTWATEKHGGSDIGATTTVARPIPGKPGEVTLTGLKWFTSNANGGLALATARPEGGEAGSAGLGVYLVPTHLADGAHNPMRIRRLKEKLGTRGVPTGEIDLTDTWAMEVAPPPRGFKLMMEALEFSRIHNAMASAGVQRRAFLEALDYASKREAFGHRITRYPMVQDEILKLMVDMEASVALSFEAAHAFDAARVHDVDAADEPDRLWLRIVTAFAKFSTAEDAVAGCRRALEIVGGNAYTADYVMPRILRDAQALTVWEGPANIQSLELLRMIGNRYPGADLFRRRVGEILEAAPEGLAEAAGMDVAGALDAAFKECCAAIELVQSDKSEAQRHARKLLAFMSDVFAAALLLDAARLDLEAGSRRKAVVAGWFVKDRLARPARRGILPGENLAQRHFEDLVHYRAF